LAINATEFYSAEWAREKSMYQDVYETPEEMDAEINLLAEKLAKSNPEAMSQLKEIFWKGTEHWDDLLSERAGISGNLVLSDFTVNAINQFKNK
jgi:methylglutaconyl-CoA hydratase